MVHLHVVAPPDVVLGQGHHELLRARGLVYDAYRRVGLRGFVSLGVLSIGLLGVDVAVLHERPMHVAQYILFAWWNIWYQSFLAFNPYHAF